MKLERDQLREGARIRIAADRSIHKVAFEAVIVHVFAEQHGSILVHHAHPLSRWDNAGGVIIGSGGIIVRTSLTLAEQGIEIVNG